MRVACLHNLKRGGVSSTSPTTICASCTMHTSDPWQQHPIPHRLPLTIRLRSSLASIMLRVSSLAQRNQGISARKLWLKDVWRCVYGTGIVAFARRCPFVSVGQNRKVCGVSAFIRPGSWASISTFNPPLLFLLISLRSQRCLWISFLMHAVRRHSNLGRTSPTQSIMRDIL